MYMITLNIIMQNNVRFVFYKLHVSKQLSHTNTSKENDAKDHNKSLLVSK